jgi:hypothetical protein
MRTMLAKTSAVALLVLACSPFTAPFSTCDLATLLAERADRSRLPPADTRSRKASLTDASLSQLVPLARTAGRGRLLTLSRPGCVSAVPRSLAATRLGAVRAAGVASQPALQTILRI